MTFDLETLAALRRITSTEPESPAKRAGITDWQFRHPDKFTLPLPNGVQRRKRWRHKIARLMGGA